MITKRILDRNRIRRPAKGFSFIPHRFLQDGFLQTLTREEILLYFFLLLVSDGNGVSFYSCTSICTVLGFEVWEFLEARAALIKKDLIRFDKNMFQVLSLPVRPVIADTCQSEDPASVRNMIIQSLKGAKNA